MRRRSACRFHWPMVEAMRASRSSMEPIFALRSTSITKNTNGCSTAAKVTASTATNGRIGIKHVRAIMPLPGPTGWHWHDMTAHFVFVLRGSLTFRFAGIDGDVVVAAGSGISQPAGVAHNVVARFDDLELLEINVPADYGTFDLAVPKDAAQP